MEIIKLSQQAVKKAKEYILNGKIVAFPTDTVYGFMADASNKKAVLKIFKIKNRPLKKPLALFVKNLKDAQGLAFVSLRQEKILKKHWPGKYTFVLKRKPKQKLYGVDKKTIALRIPKYMPLNALLGKPLVQSSANISGKPVMKSAKDIFIFFEKRKYKPDLIVDGGIKRGKPSKIFGLNILTRLR